MSLTDDPMYQYMTKGEDTDIIVGTITVSPEPNRRETFPLFLIDYHGKDMEKFVSPLFDDLKKINLIVKEGTYKLATDDASTTLMFAHGEQAAHTAPMFWADYTPSPDEHQAFQREYARLGIWLLFIATTEKLREFVIDPEGVVLVTKIHEMTPELRKNLGLR